MTAYRYKALAANGQVSKGVVEGESERQVRSELRARQLQPIDVTLAPSNAGVDSSAGGSSRIPGAALTIVIRQLATLVNAGVPLDESLAAAARQTPAQEVRSLLLQVRAKVVAGQSFAASLSSFSGAFSPLFQSTVRAGEHAGKLGVVLEQLADHQERRRLMQQKLKMALMYPASLLFVALTVISLLLVLVIPDLIDLFARTDTPLPFLTRVLVGTSTWLTQWWWLLLLLILILAGIGRWLLRFERWQMRRDKALLLVPVVGRVMVSADTARFASTLSILVQSGVALMDAIRIGVEVMANAWLREKTMQVAMNVEEGGSLAAALERCGFFPPMLLQMVASGENTGTLALMLGKAASSQEQELELHLNTMLKVLEPLIIVIMAVLVGAIVLSVLLPVMQMNSLIT